MKAFVKSFLAWAASTPDAPAVMDRCGADSYAVVNTLSAGIAQELLKRLPPEKEARVALLLPRDRNYVTVLLAIVRSGFAAVPLDAEYPGERIQTVLADAGCTLCVTTKELSEKAGGFPLLLADEVLSDSAEQATEPDAWLDLSDADREGLLLYTSGSTGRPKGVLHRQDFFSCGYEYLSPFHAFTPEDRIGCMAGFTFVASLYDLIPPLMSGGSVYIADEVERRNADRLFALIQKRRLTGMYLPPQMFTVLRELYGPLPLEYVLLAGEKVRGGFPDDCCILEGYGTSETGGVLLHRAVGEDTRLLGKPAGGNRVFLLDENDSPIREAGRIGELCVVSPWLADGYLNLPDETAARFVECPFEPGRKMFRTGDYMVFSEQGDLLFHGRKDRMVKLRGFRVELGEIETVMRRNPAVKEAACVVLHVGSGDKLCCCYTGTETGPAELRAYAASLLPDYMVPDYMVPLKAMPLNERGKVDYRALEGMEPPADTDEYTAPENETEETVSNAFASALGRKRVSALADFFALGGTSLSAAILIAKLGALRRGLSFQDIVQHPTPRALAVFLSTAPGKAHSIPDQDRDCYPLTRTQMGIYLEALSGGNGSTYTCSYLMRCDPSVTAGALLAAVREVVSAHPSMKYVIRPSADGIPRAFPAPDADVEIPVTEGTEEKRLDFMSSFMPVVPVTDGLLFHFAVYRTDERCYLALKSHLIFLDGSSISLLIAELNRALTGEELQREACTIQQVALYEEQLLQDGFHEKAKQYYADLFRGMEDTPSLTGDREGPLTPGVSENLRYEPGTLKAECVKAFCEKNRITESSFFMGAMALLLSKYLNTRQVSFSMVYNGRALSEMSSTFGTLIKRIPVCAQLKKDQPVGEYLRGISHQIFSSMSNDIYSFDEVLRDCPVNDDVELIYQGDLFTDKMGATGGKMLIEGDKWFMEHYHTGMVTGCLSIQLFSTGGLYNMTLEYRNERFSPAWVQRFAEDLFLLSEGLLTQERIGGIVMQTEDDRKKLARFNDTRIDIGFVPVQEQIRAWARKDPDRVAVTAAGRMLRFGELDRLSDRVASALLRRGLKRESLAGVLFDREVWNYVAEIGILKAGGAFVPFIPDYPDDRIDFCMEDGDIAFMLTTASLYNARPGLRKNSRKILPIEELLAEDEPMPAAAPSASHELAYCIYTSGTTGRPKGVMIEHRNIANYVHRNEKSPEILSYTAPGRVSLALAAFSFDVSVVEEFVPLCNGNPVVIATNEEIHSPVKLAALIRQNGITGITCTPTYLLSLLDIPESREAIRQLDFFDIGAEAFPAQLYRRLRELREDSIILNVYGPTEATMGCAAEVIKSDGLITIGRPIANTSFYIADPFGNELPAGIRGELIICGDQVGRGYIKLPGKTAEAFFHHNGLRAYHSGDLAAWTPEGKIRLFGRADNQVKLRGFRIELDEIENVMMETPGVNSCAAVVRGSGGKEYLVGYYTAQVPLSPEEVRKAMLGKLPDYMVPKAMMQLSEMPMTVNGKTDRKALPEPAREDLRSRYVAPASEDERKLCAAFATVLALPAGEVGLLDDFFELGGNSLSAMSVIAEADIRQLTYADIFQYRTPGQIAGILAKRARQYSGLNLDEMEARERQRPHILTPLQDELLDRQLFIPQGATLSTYQFLVRFDGTVDPQRLCDAVNLALKNHPALAVRIFFDDNCELRQQYDPSLVPHVEVREILPSTEEILPEILIRPFNRLLNASLCRTQLFHGQKGTYLFMDVHHLAVDGLSLNVILRSIVNAYFGRELKKDYYFACLAMEEERIRSSFEEDKRYHMERYGGTDWCRMPFQDCDASAGGRGEFFSQRLPYGKEEITRAQLRLGASLSVMQIAATLLALSRISGEKDVMVSWIFSDRPTVESQDAAGNFVKVLMVACSMDEFHSLQELLCAVKEQVVSGIAHSTFSYPLTQLVPWQKARVQVNLHLDMNGSELDELNAEVLALDNVYDETFSYGLFVILQGNEYKDGGFDLVLIDQGARCSNGQLRLFHKEVADVLEGIILQDDYKIEPGSGQ